MYIVWMAPRKRFNMTMDPKIQELGKRLAEEDNRTLSNYLETLILRDHKAKEGRTPYKAPRKRRKG